MLRDILKDLSVIMIYILLMQIRQEIEIDLKYFLHINDLF